MKPSADENCYTVGDGTCVSPFACLHGDGVSLEAFLKTADDDQLNWLIDEIMRRKTSFIRIRAEDQE